MTGTAISAPDFVTAMSASYLRIEERELEAGVHVDSCR